MNCKMGHLADIDFQWIWKLSRNFRDFCLFDPYNVLAFNVYGDTAIYYDFGAAKKASDMNSYLLPWTSPF